jgi:hypothetical protein
MEMLGQLVLNPLGLIVRVTISNSGNHIATLMAIIYFLELVPTAFTATMD